MIGRRPTRSRVSLGWWVLPLAVFGLAVSACGGGGGLSGAGQAGGDTVASSGDSNGSSEAPSIEGIDLPDGLPTAGGLIPELAGLPVPEGAVFGVGDAYDSDVDPRETAVQQVFFAIPAEEVVAFYLDELPAAGYEIVAGSGGGISEKSEIVAGQLSVVIFNRPDGMPGHVTIGPGQVAVSQMNINVFLSGVR